MLLTSTRQIRAQLETIEEIAKAKEHTEPCRRRSRCTRLLRSGSEISWCPVGGKRAVRPLDFVGELKTHPNTVGDDRGDNENDEQAKEHTEPCRRRSRGNRGQLRGSEISWCPVGGKRAVRQLDF